MKQWERDKMYEWGYSRSEIDAIEEADAAKRDEAKFMADEPEEDDE
jgi:hypothetical protein